MTIIKVALLICSIAISASAQTYQAPLVRAEQRGGWTIDTATITKIDSEATSVSSPLHVEISDSDENKTAMISPIRELRVVQGIRLVGSTFSNGFFDYNFWSSGTVTSGTIEVSSGSMFLYASSSTTGAINGSAAIQSNRIARFVSGSANEYRAIIRITTTVPSVGINDMRWGVSDAIDTSTSALTNGFFFRYSNGAFYVGSRLTGTEINIATGSFNGTVPTIGSTYYRYQIIYTNVGANFYVNDVLVHRLSPDMASLTTTVNFKARVQNVNSSGCNARNLLEAKVLTILRLGTESTVPKYKYIPGTGNNLLKFGPGFFHHIVLNDPGAAGSTVSVYDSTYTVTANLVAVINSAKNVGPAIINYDLPFDNGLFVVTGGAVGNITVVYE